MSFRDAFSSVVVAGVLAACAASPRAPAVMRQAPEGPEPTTVEEAQADIARWREVLAPGSNATTTPRRLETDRPGAPTTTTTPPPATMPAPPASGPSETMSESRSHAADASEELSSDSGEDARARACVTPCRAIASMRRSVAALCRLSGEDDARCVDARKTLADSEQRVASCGC